MLPWIFLGALFTTSAENKPATFTTPFAEDATAGHTFSPRSIREIVPGTVYLLSGFEFTEYYFVVSADRRESIAIDAGTRSDTARAAGVLFVGDILMGAKG